MRVFTPEDEEEQETSVEGVVNACLTLVFVIGIFFLVAALGFTAKAFHLQGTAHRAYMILCFCAGGALFVTSIIGCILVQIRRRRRQ